MRQALEAGGTAAARRALDGLVARFGRDNVAVELTHELDPLADERYDALAGLAGELRLPLVATTAAHYHGPRRRPLATALAAVRARTSLDELDGWLPAWAGQHLRSGDEMAARFARWPGAVAAAARLGTEIAFPLRLIAPDLPPFPVPPGHDEMSYLRELTGRGFAERFAGKPHAERARRDPRARAGDHRAAALPRLLPGGVGHRPSSAGSRASWPRAAARPPTPRSATPCRSPRSTPSTTT